MLNSDILVSKTHSKIEYDPNLIEKSVANHQSSSKNYHQLNTLHDVRIKNANKLIILHLNIDLNIVCNSGIFFLKFLKFYIGRFVSRFFSERAQKM